MKNARLQVLCVANPACANRCVLFWPCTCVLRTKISQLLTSRPRVSQMRRTSAEDHKRAAMPAYSDIGDLLFVTEPDLASSAQGQHAGQDHSEAFR